MEKVKDTTKQYQWKKGESFGKIVSVASVDSTFTHFTDGNRINNAVIQEFMEEIIDGVIPLPGAGALGGLANGIATENKPVVNKTKPRVLSTKSPLEELVTKLSKKNIEPLEVTLNLNIPNRPIFDMLIDNADEDRDNLINTIAKVAVSQIEINKLQEYLTEEVKDFINNYYNE